MNKEQAIELWQDYLTGDIVPVDAQKLETFLSANPEVKRELDDLEKTWSLFNDIDRPEPSTDMDAKFHGMMAAYRSAKKEYSSNILDLFGSWLSRGWQVGIASLILGLGIGWWLLPSQGQKNDIQNLSSEIQEMKKMMVLTLIEQPKAQERIKAVNLISELPSADERVIDALVIALNMDGNLNVRLAALESLVAYGELALVRKELIRSIQIQESPLMQVSIADALVAIQAKNSIETLEKLKETVEDNLVKEKLNESIKNLKSI